MPKIPDSLLTRGVAELIGGDALRRKLEADPTKVVIKYGVDPTRPDIHLGHAVCLRKLREFQDLGCRVVFLIGDLTAQIGDPTGKSKLRPELDQAAVEANLKTYLDQAGRILLIDPAHFSWIRNSDWFVSIHDVRGADGQSITIEANQQKITTPPLPGNHLLARAHAWDSTRMQSGAIKHFSFLNILATLRRLTHSRLIERDMFQERITAGEPIFMHELLYPVIQGIDSSAIFDIFGACDLELGGTDQHFNMLMGREVLEINSKPPQAVLTMPILPGTDGTAKMSKSLENFIAINESPTEMFGKTLRIPDEMIQTWAELCTDLDPAALASRVASGENPKAVKVDLAKAIVTLYHSAEVAEKAAVEFDRVHAGGAGGQPDEIATVQLEEGNWNIVELLVRAKLVPSKSEARRLIEGGGVRIDGAKVESIETSVAVGAATPVLQVGKRRFAKIVS